MSPSSLPKGIMSRPSSTVSSVQFAQKLAANEKHIRDKAVEKLKEWISLRSSSSSNVFTEEDLLRLWKGLFYCMWMSDKPLIQAELADTLSELIHTFANKESSLLFIRCFFVTMNREWDCIDYYRMDKFMMFVRRFLNQSFELLHKLKWDEEATQQLLDILNVSVINPSLNTVSTGLQLHVADIYVEELVKVAADKVEAKQLTKFLQPYCHVLANTYKSSVRKTVIPRVFEFTMRLHDWDGEQEEEETNDATLNGSTNETEKEEHIDEEGSGDDSESDLSECIKEMFDRQDELNRAYGKFKGEREFLRRVRKHELKNMEMPLLKFDYKGIADEIINATKQSACKHNIRVENYILGQRFLTMANGVFPLDAVNTSLEEHESDEHVEAAALDLLEEDESYYDANRRGKKLSKRKRMQLDKSSDEMENQLEEECVDYEDQQQIHSTRQVKKTEGNKENHYQSEGCPVPFFDKLAERMLSKARSNADDDISTVHSKNDKRKKRKIVRQSYSDDTLEVNSNTETVAKNELGTKKQRAKKRKKAKSVTGCTIQKCTSDTETNCSPEVKVDNLEIKEENIKDEARHPVEDSDILKCDELHLSEDLIRKTSIAKENFNITTKEIKNQNIHNDNEIIETNSFNIQSEDSRNSGELNVAKSLGHKDDTSVNGATEAVGQRKQFGKKKSTLTNVFELEPFPSTDDLDDETTTESKNESHNGTSLSEIKPLEQTPDHCLNAQPNPKSESKRKKVDYVTLSTSVKKKSGLLQDDWPAQTPKRLKSSSKFMTKKSVIHVGTPVSEKKVKGLISKTKFNDFENTSPAYFRTAMKKKIPKTSPKAKTNDAGPSVLTSAKKVYFQLSKNVMQGAKEYIYSVKNSPGIPYDAKKQPSQGVLKTKPTP